MNDIGCHWYLLVVDFVNKNLVLLDSCPDPHRLDFRVLDIKYMVSK